MLAPPAADALIDSAGLLIYRSRRPYLRGNRQPARDRCLVPCAIFGADGACAAYRRAMLEDIALTTDEGREYFDNDFVMYREDVDLAWRAQLFGWASRYEPAALGYHVRSFHLGRARRQMDPFFRRISVRNGWFLLVKNDEAGALLRNLPFVLLYQAKILVGLLTIEWSSLGAIGAFLPAPAALSRQARADSYPAPALTGGPRAVVCLRWARRAGGQRVTVSTVPDCGRCADSASLPACPPPLSPACRDRYTYRWVYRDNMRWRARRMGGLFDPSKLTKVPYQDEIIGPLAIAFLVVFGLGLVVSLVLTYWPPAPIKTIR